MKTILASLLAATAMTATAFAAEHGGAEPAIVYDLGGKFDKSFNEAAYNGAERFKEATGTEYSEFEITSDAQREQALRRFAERGNSPVVMAGFSYGNALEKVAKDFPDTQFVIIDAVVEAPNVQSIVFKEQEGSYLAGIAAAMAAESGTVGFVGGMDIPLIRRFACGYVGGAKSAGATEVLQNMTGTTGAAWNDPVRGGELAKNQISQGADVVYHAAGGTGVGVLQAAADEGKLGIGVDSNQNALQPGSVLTSMLKKVDVAVEGAMTDAMKGELTTGGVEVLGLAEDGVALAMDSNNADLMSEEMMAAIDEAKAKIVSGEITVHDYMSDESCPY